MAHFSELNEANEIIRTIVISNQDILDANGQESEAVGIALAQRLTRSTNRWIQVSYNGTFRRQYPRHDGFVYYDEFDAVIEPSPFPSWNLDDAGYWQAPIPKPAPVEQTYYVWNEDTLSWDSIYVPTTYEAADVPVIGE